MKLIKMYFHGSNINLSSNPSQRVFDRCGWTRIHAIFLLLLCSFLIGCPKSDNGVGPTQTPQYTYSWKIDTLTYDLPEHPAPYRFVIQSIWGSSSHDVWAVSPSDVAWGELWHYDGKKWHAMQWPWMGTDEIGLYGGYLYATTGFDSTNVFVFSMHAYDDSEASAAILKWNGNSWSDLAWKNNQRAVGGIAWGVRQNNSKLWAITSTGAVIKYENGLLSSDQKITNYRIGTAPVIAALDNGEVYVNPYKDSIDNGNLVGSITKLYKRDIQGNWTLVENKFIAGDYYDDNGLGGNIYSVGNKLFTGNYGLWQRVDTGWIKRMNIYDIGGVCLNTEDDIWVYFNHELYHFNENKWETISVPILTNNSDCALYGQGWSDGIEIFIGVQNGIKSFVLHGKKIPK